MRAAPLERPGGPKNAAEIVRCRSTLPACHAFVLFVRSKVVLASLVSFGLLVTQGPLAHGQCPGPVLESPLRAELSHEAHKARTWRYVWTGLNVGSAVLSAAALPLLPKSTRPDLIIGGATSALSGAFTWFWPLDVEAHAARAERIRCWPTALQTPELLRLREQSARDEAERVRWPWHVGNFVSALIPGALLWFGFHEHVNGALSVAGSFASGELELLTQPTHLANSAAPTSIGRIVPVLSAGGALLSYQQSW